MELNSYFKSIIEQDRCPVVICDTEHQIIYMNPAAIKSNEKHGGAALIGKSLLDCHDPASCQRIRQVVEWFSQSKENNIVYTFHNKKVNKDVYMIALRDDAGDLIGYYEKHEFRSRETGELYAL